MKRAVYNELRQKAIELYEKAGIVLTEQEKDNIEVADYGLEDVYNTCLLYTSRCV